MDIIRQPLTGEVVTYQGTCFAVRNARQNLHPAGDATGHPRVRLLPGRHAGRGVDGMAGSPCFRSLRAGHAAKTATPRPPPRASRRSDRRLTCRLRWHSHQTVAAVVQRRDGGSLARPQVRQGRIPGRDRLRLHSRFRLLIRFRYRASSLSRCPDTLRDLETKDADSLRGQP